MLFKILSPLQGCVNVPSISPPTFVLMARINGHLVGGVSWMYPTGEWRPAAAGEHYLVYSYSDVHCVREEQSNPTPRWIANETGAPTNNLRDLDQHRYYWGAQEFKVVAFTDIPAGRIYVTAESPHVQVSTGHSIGYLLEYVRDTVTMSIRQTTEGWTVLDSEGKVRLFFAGAKEPRYLPTYEEALAVVASHGATPLKEGNPMNLPAGTLVTMETQA